MGSQEAAPQLFYDFRLEDHVPAYHTLRGIDRFRGMSSLRERPINSARSETVTAIPPKLSISPFPSL
jgi:hypothetical protein